MLRKAVKATCLIPFQLSENGRLYIANGIDAVLRWDALAGQISEAGVVGPATALTVGGSGVGGIVGDYQAYVRWVTDSEYFSNFSPISAVYTPVTASGTITGVTSATPMVVTTSGAHGLTTGTVVKIVGVGGSDEANNTWGITVLTATTFSLEGSVSPSVDYTGGGTYTAGVATISYTNVPVPTDPKVVRKQILRNTDGQLTTFYVDVDSSALATTSFTSTRLDDELSVQVAVPLLFPDSSLSANRYDPPPNNKCFLASHLGRMFLAGEVTYVEGAVILVNGSTSVTGIGTIWTEQFAGRSLYVEGAQARYDILSVNTTTQVLTLTTPYLGVSDPYAPYAIRAAPAEKRLVYFTEALLPEAWPPFNALSIQDDNDDITGLMVAGSFLYILERRHIYRFTFQNNPVIDGFVFLSAASRGCINNRCWVQVDGSTLMLDEQGVHDFSGGRQSESVSDPIQGFFRGDDPHFSINWSASHWFHGVLYPTERVVRWFVSLAGDYLPRHALCFEVKLKRWWIEEFAVPIGASIECHPEAGRPLVQLGRPLVYLGSNAARTLVHGENLLDGVDPTACTTRGVITAVGLLSLADSTASFTSANLVGHPVVVVDGVGKGQARLVVAVPDGKTLTLDRPWTTLPAVGATYQCGGLNWLARFGWFRFISEERESARRFEVLFEPLDQGLMTLRLYRDRGDAALTYKSAFASRDTAGVRSERGSEDLTIDLTRYNGLAQTRMNRARDESIDSTRFISPELSGTTGPEVVRVYELSIDGVSKGG